MTTADSINGGSADLTSRSDACKKCLLWIAAHKISEREIHPQARFGNIHHLLDLAWCVNADVLFAIDRVDNEVDPIKIHLCGSIVARGIDEQSVGSADNRLYLMRYMEQFAVWAGVRSQRVGFEREIVREQRLVHAPEHVAHLGADSRVLGILGSRCRHNCE